MDTRIRKRTLLENTFEHFLVVQKLATYPTQTSRASPQKQTPKYVIRYSFPSSNEATSQADEGLYKSASLFAFPEDVKLDTIEHFTFVLTDGAGKWTFGYCRQQIDQVNGVEKCFIFLSPIPYAEGVFYKALNMCAKMDDLTTDKNGRAYLQQLHTASIGYSLGRSRNCTLGGAQNWSASPFTFPPQHGTVLPSTLEDRCLSEFYNSFTPKSMILVFASLLSERKILITSRKLSRLSSVALAFNLILYPLCWQHLFIPILPHNFGDYLEAPVPFIIGVPHSTLQKLRTNHLLGDMVFVDADSDGVLSPFPQDLSSLPPGIRTFLKKHLTKDRLLQGNGLARTFLRVFVKLMGKYEMSLVPPVSVAQSGFDSERFIRLSKPSRRGYLRSTFLELQMFRQFIEERVQAGSTSNAGDIFQTEIETDKPGKCMRRKLVSVHYPKAFPAFLPRLQDDTHRKPFLETPGNRNSISTPSKLQQRVTCDPVIMRSWSTVVTELQGNSVAESKVQDVASMQGPIEKPLIDFDGSSMTGAAKNESTDDLITPGSKNLDSAEESNKTIELLKKYGLYHFYEKDQKPDLV